MKNYYDQQQELKIAKLRLKSLKEKRELYFNQTQPGGMSFDNERVTGGTMNNSFDTYVEKIEELDVQIKLLEAEIIILEEHLKEIERKLRSMESTLQKIFVAKYIDGLSIKEMCKKFKYSRSQIYRKLRIIRKIIKDETK